MINYIDPVLVPVGRQGMKQLPPPPKGFAVGAVPLSYRGYPLLQQGTFAIPQGWQLEMTSIKSGAEYKVKSGETVCLAEGTARKVHKARRKAA